MTLAAAIKLLASTYQSLDIVAQGCPVDAAEVHAALQSAEPDSVEAICLGYLAKYNPYTPPALPPEPKTKK
jgi:hypothetical protein